MKNAFVALAASLLFAAVLLVVAIFWNQREQTRSQILSRDVALVEAIARMEMDRTGFGTGRFADALDFALGASELPGIIALAVLDRAGEPLALVPDALLWPDHSETVGWDRSHALWHRSVDLRKLFFDAGEGQRLPLLEIRVRLPEGGLDGAAWAIYWMDGQTVAREFRELDRHLASQALLMILAFAGVVSGLLYAGYRRLAKARRRLLERQQELERANSELLLMAKTSALGSLSANLVHGLKNPVAGIERFLSRIPEAGDARAAARRIRAILDNTTHMLREEEHQRQGLSFTVNEILEETRSKVKPFADEARVEIEASGVEDLEVPAREANLTLLVLVNLVENALQARETNDCVRVRAFLDGDRLAFEVHDNGPGIPEAVRAHLFEAKYSTKPGGTGLGLAISRQIARQMDGDLELVRTSKEGSVFLLRLSSTASAFPESPYSAGCSS